MNVRLHTNKPGQITLDANPSDAPCCIKIINSDGEDRLIQTDWDYPGVAATFGFSLRSVQKCDRCGQVSGDVYGYVINDDQPDEESCWGFYGLEYCEQEAKSMADCMAKRETTTK